MMQDLYVLCRVIYKSTLRLINGVQSGTPLNQENWDHHDMLNNAFESPQLPDQPHSQHVLPDDQNMSMVTSMPVDTNIAGSSIEAFPILTEPSGEFTFSLEGDNYLTKVALFAEETTWPFDNNNKNEHQDLFNYNQSQYEAPPSWDACDTFKDLDDLGFLTELNNNGYDPILDFSMPQSVDRKPTILQGQHWSHDPLDMSSKLNNNSVVPKINEDEALSYNPAAIPWELHKESESFSVTESGTQSAISSSLQSILESIPASHASAVENPVHKSGWSLEGQPFDVLLPNGSSKHHKYKLLNQPWRRASPGKGYKFVAGLVVLSGTSWFVVVLMVAKIARLLWKMIFC
uniref:NAC domain-containing protein n=1 Tax=Fagus sylvatica TaxID=28930 RepID=A0A2N9IAY9_FAGSY